MTDFVSFCYNLLSLQGGCELQCLLLWETLHKIWTVLNRDLDWNIFDNEDGAAVKEKGENT